VKVELLRKVAVTNDSLQTFKEIPPSAPLSIESSFLHARLGEAK